MNKRAGVVFAAIALFGAAIAVYLLFLTGPKDESGGEKNAADASASAPGSSSPPPESEPQAPIEPHRPAPNTVDARKPYDIGVTVDKRVTHTEDGKHIFNEAVAISRGMHNPETSGEEDMARLYEVLGFYRMVFKENPVAADNQTVMSALMGNNSRGIVVFPSDHPSLNEKGELVDRWETPYYFHALSGKQMEIISTGPDKQLGTNDDLIFTERDTGDFYRGVTPVADPQVTRKRR